MGPQSWWVIEPFYRIFYICSLIPDLILFIYLILVRGLPSPHPRLLYTLPLSYPPVCGAFYLMAPTNRAVVQRTWGLHELDARRMALRINNSASASETQTLVAEKQRRTYGRQFKYDEFIVMSNTASAITFGIVFALGAMALIFIPPVRLSPIFTIIVVGFALIRWS